METKDELLSEGEKYFEKLMKPWFMEMKSFHHITREQAMFLLSNAVQSEIYIYDNDKDDQRAGGGI